MLYKFILVNSRDLSHIGELSRAADKKFDVVLSKPGSATFTYPMDAEYANQIIPYQTGIKVMRHNRRASIVAGKTIWECVWSGYVLPIDESVSANRMAVSCVGWMQRLGKRMLRRQKLYNNQGDGAIVADLIAEANLTTAPDGYAVPVVAGSSPNTPTWLQWGGTMPNEGEGGATAYDDTNAKRNKNMAMYSPILTQIDELVTIENGGDIVCDPVTRSITWHRRYRRVKDDVVFGFQWGPRNLEEFGRNIEADAQLNYLVVTGAPGTTPQYSHNVGQQSLIGLIEETTALSDVRDNSVLLAYSGAEVIMRAGGHVTYNVTPFMVKPDQEGNVPEPFQDFRLGDQCRLTAVHPPRINIRGQAIRVFGFGITIDNNGVSKISQLQIAP